MLQKFYITNLGRDQLILGYPWLQELNPQINWPMGTFDGNIWLETIPLAWQKWREQQQKTMEANKANFTQEWSHAAMKDTPVTTELPKQYE